MITKINLDWNKEFYRQQNKKVLNRYHRRTDWKKITTSSISVKSQRIIKTWEEEELIICQTFAILTCAIITFAVNYFLR